MTHDGKMVAGDDKIVSGDGKMVTVDDETVTDVTHSYNKIENSVSQCKSNKKTNEKFEGQRKGWKSSLVVPLCLCSLPRDEGRSHGCMSQNRFNA